MQITLHAGFLVCWAKLDLLSYGYSVLILKKFVRAMSCNWLIIIIIIIIIITNF